MKIDVHLEFIEGRTLSCIEDSAGIFGSILGSSQFGEVWMSAVCSYGGKHFLRTDMPDLIEKLSGLIPLVEGNAGRRHVEQVMQLAQRCSGDRTMRLSFIPRPDLTPENLSETSGLRRAM